MNLIFYDGQCPFCNFWVGMILKIDKKKKFQFASLQGKTAYIELRGAYRKDSIVLLQEYGTEREKEYDESKAVLRIFWLLGGIFSILGILSFLPSFLFDWIYRLVAKNRSRLFTNCPRQFPGTFSDRFLE